ncbi:MAG TPA: nitroreductase family protein [Candidatus Limnocylindrales bacterium]|nr:nitroreductase family protein [Candidatus Limnocylindrales bacterium]
MSIDPTDVLRPLRRTRQVREFEPTPVDPDILDALADVARWTGSSKNSQPWRFIVITEPATIRAIHDAGLPQTRGLATAPAAIAIVLPAAPDRAVGHAYDEGRAAERILVAARMLDIGAGISWIPAAVRPAIAALLDLPAGRMVRTIVQLGHPTEEARRPKSAPGEARLPRQDIVFRERWPANDPD